jgi:hypothetical protein
MTIREVMHHRAVRVVIGTILVVISTIAMLNSTHIDGTLLALMLFVIVNITHLFCDKLWSWLMLLPFFVAYIILLWINFFRDYHLLGSKYLVDEYIHIGGLFIGISIILFIMCYLLKPPHKVS